MTNEKAGKVLERLNELGETLWGTRKNTIRAILCEARGGIRDAIRTKNESKAAIWGLDAVNNIVDDLEDGEPSSHYLISGRLCDRKDVEFITPLIREHLPRR